MRIAAQVPWLDPRALVDLGGGAGGDELAAQVADVSKRGFYARFPMTAARLLSEQLRLDDIVAQLRGLRRAAPRARTPRSTSPSSPTKGSRGPSSTSRRSSSGPAP